MVIAIIGMLSAVVLASLSSSRLKADDAAIQADVETIQTQAEVYYYGAGGNSYGSPSNGICPPSAGGSVWNDVTVANAIKALYTVTNGGSDGLTCYNTYTAYAISARLNVPSPTLYWCVDSTGKAGTTTSAISAPNC